MHNFPTDSLDFKTIADLHASLKEDGYLSDKDTKNKTITLRVDLYEEESINSVRMQSMLNCDMLMT